MTRPSPRTTPGRKLPDTAIAVASRSDGSGTNYVFTDYLAKVSPAFKAKVGVGKSVKWPVGLGGKGNEGVTGLVKATPGAIGYLELAYAIQNQLPMAAIQNADGAFVKPSIEATSAAAAGVAVPDDFRVSITNAPGKDAYPISSFTYLLVYKDQTNKEKGAGSHRLPQVGGDGRREVCPGPRLRSPAGRRTDEGAGENRHPDGTGGDAQCQKVGPRQSTLQHRGLNGRSPPPPAARRRGTGCITASSGCWASSSWWWPGSSSST